MTTFQSYVRGATDAPLMDETIGDFLDRVAAEFGDAPALTSPSQGIAFIRIKPAMSP